MTIESLKDLVINITKFLKDLIAYIKNYLISITINTVNLEMSIIINIVNFKRSIVLDIIIFWMDFIACYIEFIKYLISEFIEFCLEVIRNTQKDKGDFAAIFITIFIRCLSLVTTNESVPLSILFINILWILTIISVYKWSICKYRFYLWKYFKYELDSYIFLNSYKRDFYDFTEEKFANTQEGKIAYLSIENQFEYFLQFMDLVQIKENLEKYNENPFDKTFLRIFYEVLHSRLVVSLIILNVFIEIKFP